MRIARLAGGFVTKLVRPSFSHTFGSCDPTLIVAHALLWMSKSPVGMVLVGEFHADSARIGFDNELRSAGM